jgi:fructokinase
MEHGKGPQYIFYAEKTADCSLSAEDLPLHLPADTQCIVFGSIAMTMEPMASAIETLILRESGREIPVISFDPNIRPFMIRDRDAYMKRFEKWVGASAITKISAEDLEFIYPRLEPGQALRKILAMGSRLVICTLGIRGAQAMLRRDDGSITEVSAPVVYFPAVVDTVGAGDTFHGAFLSWLELRGKMSLSALVNLNNTDLYDALIFANNAASIVCSRRGADPPTFNEVENVKTS